MRYTIYEDGSGLLFMSYVKFKRISYNIQQGSIIESWIGYTMLLSQIELFYTWKIVFWCQCQSIFRRNILLGCILILIGIISWMVWSDDLVMVAGMRWKQMAHNWSIWWTLGGSLCPAVGVFRLIMMLMMVHFLSNTWNDLLLCRCIIYPQM